MQVQPPVGGSFPVEVRHDQLVPGLQPRGVQRRAEGPAESPQPMTTVAPLLLEQTGAFRQDGRPRLLHRFRVVADPAGRLHQLPGKQGEVPVGVYRLGLREVHCRPLAPVADRASEPLRRVDLQDVAGVRAERVRGAGHHGVVHPTVAGDAPVECAQVRHHDLVQLDRGIPRLPLLLRIFRAPGQEQRILLLVLLPRDEDVLGKPGGDEEQESDQARGKQEFLHAAPSNGPANGRETRRTPSWAPGNRFRPG